MPKWKRYKLKEVLNVLPFFTGKTVRFCGIEFILGGHNSSGYIRESLYRDKMDRLIYFRTCYIRRAILDRANRAFTLPYYLHHISQTTLFNWVNQDYLSGERK